MRSDARSFPGRDYFFRALVLLSILGVIGCSVEKFESNQFYICATDADCIDGYACQTEGEFANSCRMFSTGSDCDDKDGDLAFAGPNCVTVAVEDQDCDDDDPQNFPGNVEVCDGRDNNCNGEVDEGVAPLACPLNTNGVCAIAAPTQACVDGAFDAASCVAGCDGLGSMTCPYGDQFVATEDAASGACDDGADNDCDGQVDTDDASCPQCTSGGACGGFVCGGGVANEDCACFSSGTDACVEGEAVCQDAEGATIPEPFDRDEVPANGVDDDCDGEIDEVQ